MLPRTTFPPRTANLPSVIRARQVDWWRPLSDSNFPGEKQMGIVLAVVFAAIFFYVLYWVNRAGTRDGIIAAREAENANRTGDSVDRS